MAQLGSDVRQEGLHVEAQGELLRILESPFFRTSKRCSTMLRYIVEHALTDPALPIKERTIGVEVFARATDYDTTNDPVVRTTAGEIRKRLAQYAETHADAKVHITLPSGSYLPVIRLDRAEEIYELALTSETPLEAPAIRALPEPVLTMAELSAPTEHPSWRRASLIAFVAFSLVIVTLSVIRWRLARQDALSMFWNPIAAADRHPTIVLGDLSTLRTQSRDEAAPTMQSGLVKTAPGSKDELALADVTAMNNIVGYLAPHTTAGSVLNAAAATYAQVRDQPLILLGGRSNQWSMREMKRLPFQIVDGPSARMVGIRDTKQGGGLLVLVDFNTPYEQVKREYALVARFRDPETNQPTVVIAGVGANGTVAGSVFATQARYLNEFAAKAPAGWASRNVEIVLETELVNGDYAPPKVIRTALW